MASLLKACLFILLVSFLTLVFVSVEGNVLKRQKREWIIAPRKLKENHDYTGLASIARIRSDKENHTTILYYLTGPGVDQPPMNVFGIDHTTGYVKIFSILDREEIPFYHLKGVAKYTDGTVAEKNLDLKITVLDENDCTPVIKAEQVGSVSESSAAGTVVMKVIVTDADEEGTLNTKISYGIVGSSSGMFYINAQSGVVMVRQNTLDREKQDTYTLTVTASDWNGRPGGNTGSGQIQIKILDINDNIPYLEKESYEGSVMENTINVEVIRIKALDMDMIHTDNWLAVFHIISGNEGGYFSITTNVETNEGIIMINKALDYEELKVLNLEVSVSNKAEYYFGSGSIGGAGGGGAGGGGAGGGGAGGGGSIVSKTYPIKINVVNQKEGPRFQPTVKVVTISEDHTSITLNKIITNYAAIDSDTLQIATNVRYVKIRDDDNWLNVDVKTADIRLNKMPDRESKFLINGTYYAKIICVTNETPAKTATGTIAIQVEDYNDHCPTLTATTHTMCLETNVIYVVAEDADAYPNSAPFDFSVIHGSSKGKWKVEPLNETAAILRDEADLWPGLYKVAVDIKDQQGKSCADVQVIDVVVCTCTDNTKTCVARTTKTSTFGAAGILLLLLGLLLLLLVPLLLLFCLCGGAAAAGNFKAIPFDTKQQLISYHTEGQGEDKEVPLLTAPVEVDGGTIKTQDINVTGKSGYLDGIELGGAQGGSGGGGYGDSFMTTENVQTYSRYKYGGQTEMDYVGAGMMTGQEHLYSRYRAGAFDGMALSDQFLGEYYSSKYDHSAKQSQQKDALLVYDYEGQESLAGSVGCCSLLENDNDLAFLDDLGPKFKTLAEICRGSSLVTETVEAKVSVPPLRPVSPIRLPTHTHTHTHSETIRDRDQVNISSINTSNIASGSSTFVQEEKVTESASMVPQVHVQDKYVIPSQTLLIQQPTMYVAAAPMYVVEPKPQMVLVSGAQQAVGQVGHIGLGQGLVQVGGIQSSQGVVLVDRQVGMGGATGQIASGLSHGTTSRSRKVLVMENGSSGGEQVAHIAQGFVKTGHGSAEQGEVRGQGMQSFSVSSHGSVGSHEDILTTAAPKVQGSKKVVVQHKKLTVTEKSSESSLRA